MATDPLAMLRGLMGGGFAQPQAMGSAPAPQMGGSFLPTGYTPPQGAQMPSMLGGGNGIQQLLQHLSGGNRSAGQGMPMGGGDQFGYAGGNPNFNEAGGGPSFGLGDPVKGPIPVLGGWGTAPQAQQFGAQMPPRMGAGQGMQMGGRPQGQPLSRLFHGNGRMYRYQG